jgi:threonylcarbamoyladenosine tRNA methylthiotransferase MtaB
MKYSIVTFGCRVNQADSLVIEDGLRARGGVVADPRDADVVVVNTCSVTASADQGARQTIRRIARDNPRVRIVVTGCYATRRPDEVGALPNVVRVIANPAKETLADRIDVDLGLTTADRYSARGDGACGASSLEPGIAGRTALTLRVQTGCDERCAYCIIPRTRGRCQSRPLHEVLAELRRAVAAGYREIWITGVHLGSYGRDLLDGTTLETLVRALAGSPDDVLFRISSLEPMDCTNAIVDLVADSPRLAPHFHLPLQHGADEILRLMRRPYTTGFYERLVGRIYDRMPHAAVGSDIIVGFPGETDEQVERMLVLLESLPLTYLHVFPYSDRPGTEAADLPAKVSGVAIRARAQAVRTLGERLSTRFQARQLGSRRRALTMDDGSRAITDNYLKLRIPPGRSRNEWLQVVIGGSPGALAGELASARSL